MSTCQRPVDDLLQDAEPRSITVVRPGALGDTILTLPALQWLRRRYPGAEITLIGSAWAERLRPLVPWPLRVVRFDSPALTPLFRQNPEDPPGLVREADAVVVYETGEGLAGNLGRLCPGPVIAWPVEPPAGVHAALHFARAMATVAPEDLPPPRLEAPKRGDFGSIPEDALALHPGSGGRHKCWPTERFARVAREIGRPVLLVEGPADAQPAAALRGALGCAVPVHDARGLSLPALAGALARCSAFVGNDSGVSHLAAALGLCTVAVFGATDPALWRPLGPRATACGEPGQWPEAEPVKRALADGWRDA